VQEVNQLASEFTVFSTSSTRATGKMLAAPVWQQSQK